jgi:hypothetical protein
MSITEPIKKLINIYTYLYSKKISSILELKNFAIFIAKGREGSNLPFSIELMV